MFKRFATAILVTALVVGTGAVAWAQEEGDDPAERGGNRPKRSQAQEEGRRKRPGGPPGGALFGRAIHGELLVRSGDGWDQVTFDKGTVTAVDDDSITVERPDGEEVTKALTGETRFGRGRDAGSIEIGRPAVVVSKGDTATAVMQGPKARPRGNKRPRAGVDRGEAQVPAT